MDGDKQAEQEETVRWIVNIIQGRLSRRNVRGLRTLKTVIRPGENGDDDDVDLDKSG